MAAANTPSTARPDRPPRLAGDPVEVAATGSVAGNRVMLSPVIATNGASAAQQRRRWLSRGRVGWTLALGLTVLLLAVLTAGATAQPSAPAPTPPPAQPAPSTSLPQACHTNALPYCFPSTTLTPPTTGSPTTPPTSTSVPDTCANLKPDQPRPPDCIPQPTTPPPSSGPQQPGTDGGGDESECGISDIGACITEAINAMFRGLVEAALSPILDLLGHTALSTPTIDSLPGIGELWNNSFELVVAAYGLFVLVGGIVVMGHESIQNRYSIKEIGPRLPAAFLASTLSLFFVDKLIQLANALTLGVLGGDVAPSLGDTLSEAVAGIQSGGLFIILTGLVLVVVGIGLLIVYVVRVVVTLILIVSGPLFLMCHALPHTDPLARWWWKAITAVLAIQVAQALVLITAIRTFLSGGVQLFGSALSAFGMMIAAIALFYILFKIPFWLLSAVKVSSGRSLLGGLARAYIAAKTFGMIAGKTGAFNTAAAGAASSGSSGGAGRAHGGSADPPWPTQPCISRTPDTVNERLQAAYDTERARAARRSRLPSQAPRFLQPTPQQTTHDPAVTPATPGPTEVEFSSPPTPVAPARHRPHPGSAQSGSAPQFQAAGGPQRRGATPPPVRPINAASVPPHLRFQPAASAPSAPPSHPIKTSETPGAPAFRPAQPEPRIGDAYRRTPSVPPPMFRAPKSDPGGDGK